MSPHSAASAEHPAGSAADGPAGIVGAPPSSRATWSGLLRLSLVACPVKAYPATVSSNDSYFHQHHTDCGQRVRYEKHCPLHGKLDAGQIYKGYEYAPGQHLLLDEEKLDQLRPAKDRALTLEHFVEPPQVDPSLLSGRNLYLVPDGPAARVPYGVLVAALHARHKWGVGRVALTGQRRPALVRPLGRWLMLHVLHFPAQVRGEPVVDWTVVGNAANTAEHELASQLIDAYSAPVAWSEYRDDSADELAALVAETLAGRTPAEAVIEEVPVIRLLDALKLSVAAATQAPAPAAPTTARRKRSRRSA